MRLTGKSIRAVNSQEGQRENYAGQNTFSQPKKFRHRTPPVHRQMTYKTATFGEAKQYGSFQNGSTVDSDENRLGEIAQAENCTVEITETALSTKCRMPALVNLRRRFLKNGPVHQVPLMLPGFCLFVNRFCVR